MSDPNHNLTAIVPCNDMAKSRAFYERLGLTNADGDEQYLMLDDGRGAQVHLQPAVEGWLVSGQSPFGLYFYIENVDEVAKAFSGEVLGKPAKPEDKPWGMYEFALSDPDGTLVRVGWPTRLRS